MKVPLRAKLIGVALSIFLCLAGLWLISYSHSASEKGRNHEIINHMTLHLLNRNQKLTETEARAISGMVYNESKEYGLDYRLVLAIMQVESNFRSNVVSPKGARGLLQIKPSLARFIARDAGIEWNGKKTLDKPKENIKIGVHFFSQLLKDFETVHMALSAYNVGPTRMKRVAPHREGQARGFSKQVLKEYKGNLSLLPDP